MATETVTNNPLQALPPELLPQVDHLVTEDDTPVDNVFSEKQQRLLTEPLFTSWAVANPRRSFVAMANVGLFYAVRQPAIVPDMLLSLDVELPPDIWVKGHRSYFVWLYGKSPDVVIEVVSNLEGGEDTEKLAAYARVAVGYYVIFDPEHFLSADVLRVYQLEGHHFRQMAEPVWFPEVGLGLRLWEGRYEDFDAVWLRWVDSKGQWIATGAECAAAQRQHAAEERQRADEERQRAERLAAQLRRLGVEPEER